jgi:hypothetical protein
MICDGSGGVIVYINGIAQIGTAGTAPSATSGFSIACRTDSTRLFYGLLDDIRIYNEVLNLTQVKAIAHDRGYMMGSSRPYPWQPHIVRPTIRPTLLSA